MSTKRILLTISLFLVPLLLLAALLSYQSPFATSPILLLSLAALAGINAVWVLHRERRSQRDAGELATIYKIAHSIAASSATPDQTLQTILDTVKIIVPYDGGEICLYEPASGGVRVRAWQGSFGEDSRGRLYKLGEGFTGGMAQSRTGMLVPDILKHESIKAVHNDLGKGVSVRSFVGVPLIEGDELVGTLELVSAVPNRFTSRTQRLLETIAPQAAVAIQVARKVEAREQHLQAQIMQLQIEIDQSRRQRQVEEITDTEYFRMLKAKARRFSDDEPKN